MNHIMHAKTYAWSTKEVSIVILTDVEEFKLFGISKTKFQILAARNLTGSRLACCCWATLCIYYQKKKPWDVDIDGVILMYLIE